jgi:hypothetical protein
LKEVQAEIRIFEDWLESWLYGSNTYIIG